MAMIAVEPVFLDTNVLIRANIASAPLHAEALAAIETREQANVPLWISRQVLREYLATLTRPQVYTGNPVLIQTLATQITLFEQRFQVAEDNRQVTANLIALAIQIPVGGKQIHDANIVATMQAYGIRNLLTHNVADFTRFNALITILPLQPNP